MRDAAPRRWQTGALDSYGSPRWGALSAPDAAALVAYTDGESSAACAIARDLPRARDRAADATYRRALALWCAGADEDDLRRAALAHVDALAEALRGARPTIARDARACVRWCQAALLMEMTDGSSADAALLDAGGALLAGKADVHADLWWVLSTIISLGTVAGALIPEFTKVFTSTESRHVSEVVTSSNQGGASLNILSGLVAGNYSAFWTGLCILGLMLGAYLLSLQPAVAQLMPGDFGFAAPIFAFGLVAFGFLGMGPVTIAVDSFGPVTDNAQSVYELSRIESREGIAGEIERDFGFRPDFESAKHQLEKGDGAGNTFKATAKPVLIGTAVVGATTMVFGIIMMLQEHYRDAGVNVLEKLSLVHPEALMGLLMGGAVIYWFTGASTQAVVTGAYRAVVYIKENMRLDAASAATESSKEVVRICTQYAQKGMTNIFVAVFCLALGLAFVDPFFFIGYLIGMAFFGLYQAIFMANAGGAWDNAKKIVEVDLKAKGTPLHAATVVGDTVGDPFKDTSSVSLNPVIKFTTLFGLLAVEIAVNLPSGTAKAIGAAIVAVGLVFVHRSFYGMRIPVDGKGA